MLSLRALIYADTSNCDIPRAYIDVVGIFYGVVLVGSHGFSCIGHGDSWLNGFTRIHENGILRQSYQGLCHILPRMEVRCDFVVVFFVGDGKSVSRHTTGISIGVRCCDGYGGINAGISSSLPVLSVDGLDHLQVFCCQVIAVGRGHGDSAVAICHFTYGGCCALSVKLVVDGESSGCPCSH